MPSSVLPRQRRGWMRENRVIDAWRPRSKNAANGSILSGGTVVVGASISCLDLLARFLLQSMSYALAALVEIRREILWWKIRLASHGFCSLFFTADILAFVPILWKLPFKKLLYSSNIKWLCSQLSRKRMVRLSSLTSQSQKFISLNYCLAVCTTLGIRCKMKAKSR